MNGKFLVAKYVADLERDEPRNIGVIVWTKGSVGYRFVDLEDIDLPNSVDPANYDRWINYWAELASSKKIQVFREKSVTRRSAKFLDSIKLTGKGNFQLSDGGMVLDQLNSETVDEAAQFLFERMVSRTVTREYPPSEGFFIKCQSLMHEGFGEELTTRYPVALSIGPFVKEIHFDYAIGNGTPGLLCNRVNLTRESSVTSAAGKCGSTISANLYSRDQCVSLYDSRNEISDASAEVEFLKSFSTPVDISDASRAQDQLRSLAS